MRVTVDVFSVKFSVAIKQSVCSNVDVGGLKTQTLLWPLLYMLNTDSNGCNSVVYLSKQISLGLILDIPIFFFRSLQSRRAPRSLCLILLSLIPALLCTHAAFISLAALKVCLSCYFPCVASIPPHLPLSEHPLDICFPSNLIAGTAFSSSLWSMTVTDTQAHSQLKI